MPRRKSCSSPLAATPPSKLATNTNPCHFLNRGTLFRPFEAVAFTRSKPTVTFRAPARASPPALKRSPNSSIPPWRSAAKRKPPSCQSLPAQARPAPLRFSPHRGRLPLDSCPRGQLTYFIYKTLICKEEFYDRNRNQARHSGTCRSQNSSLHIRVLYIKYVNWPRGQLSRGKRP